jgi:hypothetical protein
MKNKLKLDLQLFSEDMEAVETGVEDVPAAEVHEEVVESSETGVEPTVAAEPEKQNNFEKAFAKRLAAEREKWQKEVSEKYGDYDTHKELSTYLQEVNGLDALSLKERIELDRLQARAEKENVPPEVLKRIDDLEAKSARLEEIEKQQQTEQLNNLFWKAADDFVKDKGFTKEELNQLLVDNRMTVDPTDPEDVERKFNMAYKAMKADQLEKELASAKETAVKEYLQSKTAPRVEGSGAPGVVQEDTSKLSWKELEARMVARIQAANQST